MDTVDTRSSLENEKQIFAQARQFLRILKEKRMYLATAESCTGGFLSYTLTRIPGSSAVYIGGVVAYSEKAKTILLGVKPESMKKNGVVSRKTAEAMARGIMERLHTDIGIGITGAAGPTGHGGAEPGVVAAAVVFSSTGKRKAGVDKEEWSEIFHLRGDRTEVVLSTIELVLSVAIDLLV